MGVVVGVFRDVPNIDSNAPSAAHNQHQVGDEEQQVEDHEHCGGDVEDGVALHVVGSEWWGLLPHVLTEVLRRVEAVGETEAG